MLKLLVAVLFFVEGVYMCRWVCIDKNNNIKKHYFNQSEVTLEIPKREITLPEIPKKSRGRIPIPDITLKMPEYEVLPVQVRCGSPEFKKSVKTNAKKIRCKPSDVIVEIKYKGALKISPSKISTKLCTGVCNANKSCVSKRSENMTVAISIIDRYNQAQCSNVLVPTDTKCKCGCQMKASDCLPTQVFDKKFCKCKCANEAGLTECSRRIQNSIDKYEWNNKLCTCQCRNESVCSTGTRWDRNECKCVRQR